MRLIPTEVKDVFLAAAKEPDTGQWKLLGAFSISDTCNQVNGPYDDFGYGIKDKRKDKADYGDTTNA